MWRIFVLQDFGLEEGDVEADWRQVYAYLSRQLQICNEKTAAQPLDARVMFSDDGSPVPGYPPENSLRRGYGAWCTNSGVETDVDLVLELPEACLITHFEGANGGLFYSAPLREALVFASVHPVGLENARQYNGRMGSEWAEKLSRCHGTATPVKPAEPLVGFCFPPPPEAFNARLKKRLNRPVVARYVHFKLLRSYNAHDGRLSDNIDVRDLLTFGASLPELPQLLQRPHFDDQLPHDPSYRRMHELRVYPHGL